MSSSVENQSSKLAATAAITKPADTAANVSPASSASASTQDATTSTSSSAAPSGGSAAVSATTQAAASNANGSASSDAASTAPAAKSAANGSKTPRVPPKLAPAPVPQQTPWKAPPLDASKGGIEVADVVQQRKERSGQSQRDAKEQPSSSSTRRATTGKEKWVPFAPIVPASSALASSQNGGGSGRARSQQGGQGRRQQQGSYRQRNNKHGSGGSNNSYDKRQQRSHSSSPAPQAGSQGTRGGSASHQRTQSRARTAADAADRLEKLQVGDDGLEGTGDRVDDSNGHDQGDRQSPFTNGDSANGDRSSPRSGNSYSQPNSGYSSRASSGGPRKPRGEYRSGTGKVPGYYGGAGGAGGFVPPLGFPVPMMRVPGVTPQMPQMVSAVPPADYVFSTLVAQVDYYFSVENLCRDMYLRKQMNDEGLVPVSTLAAFNRVKMLAPNVEVVAEACRLAPNVEVVGSKARAASGWNLWVLPENDRLPEGLDNSVETSATEELAEPKFQVEQAVPFVPKSQ